MLKGIPNCLSPELLATLSMMGHGDEIILADADFPAYTYGRRVLRADGVSLGTLLTALLPLFPLDTFVDCPVAIMAPVDTRAPEPAAWQEWRRTLKAHHAPFKEYQYVERMAFYERARQSFAVVISGEPDGNLILKKAPVMM